MDMTRVGIGYDLHRLVTGRPLVLGGVRIPFERGLAGHSDADVLTHAVIDAVLGAAALGNIGQHFPDTEPRYENADSITLLRETLDLVKAAGFAVVNVDANVVAERPRLSPHLDRIRARLSDTIGLGIEGISVKAKTNEGVGPEGRGEAMSAQAVVLLEKK
ncbi:MAG: 2-C-methyl-D-erythritol 2,4-cyclodiphosphate synthase [Candidatus Hydrogenedentes bacterium]|nr:2-C-methyl-D-erythritol 2,4-cyclodiphosphate synthase [Candidatus Hydrogenedentota bacterium]